MGCWHSKHRQCMATSGKDTAEEQVTNTCNVTAVKTQQAANDTNRTAQEDEEDEEGKEGAGGAGKDLEGLQAKSKEIWYQG